VDNTYELVCDLTSPTQEIKQALKERHSSAIMVDRTRFVSKNSCCQIDTYQILELNRRGYITVNVSFFRPELSEDNLQVKFSIFSPLWGNSSIKMRKLYKEIDSVIRAHMT